MQDFYERTLQWSLEHRGTIFLVFLASLVATVGAVLRHAAGFPAQRRHRDDPGNTEAANGTSYHPDGEIPAEGAAIVNADPNVSGVMSSRQHGQHAAGSSLHLKDRSERSLSADQIIQELRPKLGAHPRPQRLPAKSAQHPHRRPADEFAVSIHAAGPQSERNCRTRPSRLTAALRARAGLPGRRQRFAPDNSDRRMCTIDRDQAAALGVTPQSIEVALGTAFGGQQISQIYGSSDEYQVIMELLPQYQVDASSLSRLYVTGAKRQSGAAYGGDEDRPHHDAAQHQPSGTTARRHRFVQSRPRRGAQRRGLRDQQGQAADRAFRTRSRPASRAPRRPSRVR